VRLLGIEPTFIGHPVRCLVTISAKLPRMMNLNMLGRQQSLLALSQHLPVGTNEKHGNLKTVGIEPGKPEWQRLNSEVR
jgi:hypothetical protein